MKNFNKTCQKGQTLISLLLFTVIAITVASAAFTILLNNLLSVSKYSESMTAFNIAESGAENGLLRLVRDPNYAGESLSVGDGNATIVVTSGTPIVLTSTGRVRDSIKIIQLEIVYNIGILNVVSWKELY